jgi:hypothetical protein
MARALAWDAPRGATAVGSAAAVLVEPSSAIQVAAIAAAALLGWRLLPVPAEQARMHVAVPIGRRTAAEDEDPVLAIRVVAEERGVRAAVL